MFWKYNSPSSVQIDSLLQKENVTLFELMEEEELLQECKVQNKKLIEFLTQPDILEELVALVINDPPPDKELKVRFKHANLASELLTCDVPAIVDKVASSTNLLQMLYKFLEKEKPLNPLLASFVSKVFGMLVQRRSEQNWYSYRFTCLQVLEFLKSRGDFVDVAVRHIGTSAIMDLLAKLICGVDDDDREIKRDIHQWLNESRLIEQLIDKLTPDCDSEEHSSVDQLLREILSAGQDTSANGSDSQMNGNHSRLLATLESEEIVDKLMDTLLHEDRNESSVSHVINILLTLLSYKGSLKQSEPYHSNCIDTCIQGNLGNRNIALTTILGRLPELQKILVQPSKLGNLKTAFNMEVERLGSTRIQVVNLIVALISTNDIEVHSKIVSLNTLQLLFDLFFKFSLNNFLHSQVTQCVTCIIKQPLNQSSESLCKVESNKELIDEDVFPKIEEIDGLNNNPLKVDKGETDRPVQNSLIEKDKMCEIETFEIPILKPEEDEENWSDPPPHPLLEQLFCECNIIQRILECYSKAVSTEKKSHDLIGYMGHIREIANGIAETMTDGPNSAHIRRYIELLPNDLKSEWEDFAQVTLAMENLKNKIIPLQMPGLLIRESDDDSDDDFTSVDEYFAGESLVIMNQGFKEGDMDTMADLRFTADDFKNAEENLSGALQRLSSQINAGAGVAAADIDGDAGNANMDLFEKMCMEREGSDITAFNDMWKDKEKDITFGTEDAKPSDEDAEHSSSEEEGEEDGALDDEFDAIRNSEEKMDVDFVPEDWSEVFDKRGSSGDIETEGDLNPWQSAPASDVIGNNSWADFGDSSFHNDSDPFSESGSQGSNTSNFSSFPMGEDSSAAVSHPTTFHASFSNVLFGDAELNPITSMTQSDGNSFQTAVDLVASASTQINKVMSNELSSSPQELVSPTTGVLHDGCLSQPVENNHEQFSVVPPLESSEQ